MNIKIKTMLIIVLAYTTYGVSQKTDNEKDLLYIQQVEDHKESDKVLHAEPLYIDLIRDLGARKGEKVYPNQKACHGKRWGQKSQFSAL